MRLIDADKILWEYKCIAKEEIDEMPTVEAIPIEWIKKYVSNNTYLIVNPKYKDMGFTEEPIDYRIKIYPAQIEVMLKEWEKENGRKKNDSEDDNTL